MKRATVVLGVLALTLGLAACGAAPVKDAYTASGDSTSPDELTKTASFKPDDDLNVVVTLNAHSRTLPIQAVFLAPGGTSYATDLLEADATVGKVLLGLDWEAQGTTTWPSGEWQVELYVEDEKNTTLGFTVQPPSEG